MLRRSTLSFIVVTLLAATAAVAIPAAAAPALPKVRLQRLATLQQPTAVVAREGDTNLWVAQRLGKVRRVDPTTGSVGPAVFDVSSEVATDAEEGLLGLAFSVDGTKAYMHFVDKQRASHIVELGIEDSDGGPRAVAGSRREVLTIPGTKRGHHYGGWLAVDGKGLLWVALGDGNGDGDKLGRAQDLSTLMGKVLRIDPKPSAGKAYSIPAGNPFATRPGARPEIWAYGLRNPWRASYDAPSATLWIGDVGEGKYEEVDRAKGGENFGWPLVEATHRLRGAAPAGATPPVYEFPHKDGRCAVMGGYVYRGAALPSLVGTYVFADLCTGDLTALLPAAGKYTAVDLGAATPVITSLGTDAAGELYAVSLNGGLFKLVPA